MRVTAPNDADVCDDELYVARRELILDRVQRAAAEALRRLRNEPGGRECNKQKRTHA